MDTQKNDGNCCHGTCNGSHDCSQCGWGWNGAVTRILLALVVAFVIFVIGVKVGEIKAELYGVDGMRYNYGMPYQSGLPMMGAPETAAPGAGMKK